MSLTTPFASVTIGSRVVIVRSFAPSGWPPVGPDRQHAQAEVVASAVRPGLGDALQDEVGKIEAQLDRILVAE